jgi:hypothetical protein
MCFRGFRDLKERWDVERREGVLEEFVDELMGVECEYMMDVLAFVYDRYNTLVRYYPRIGDELLAFVLRSPYFRIHVRRLKVSDEFPTYMRYLMVPKTSYGVLSFRGNFHEVSRVFM